MSRAWTSRHTREPGYTLLEVLVVLGILAMLFTAIPLVSSQALASIRFQEAGGQLHKDIRTVRQSARYSGKPRELNLQALAGDYAGLRVEIVGDITFYPNGTASEGRVLLHGDGRVIEIRVDGMTGSLSRVEI